MHSEIEKKYLDKDMRGGEWLRKISSWLAAPARLQTALLLVVLGIAAVMRGVALNAVGFNSDEAVYAGQAAALIKAPIYTDLFPVFRAHPLLFHVLLSLLYVFGVSDIVGRMVSVFFGIASVYVTYRLGKTLYGEAAGIFGALLLALMPYHVIVTRQVLLDGPMTFFATLTLYWLAKYAQSERRFDLIAAGAALGLTFLAKETAILFFGSVYVFFSLSPEIRVRIRHIIPAVLVSFALIAVYPLTVALAGSGTTSTAQQYVIWQFFRFPNHTADFYFRVLPYEFGPLVIALAIIGLVFLWRERSWRERLLLAWIIVPFLFFQFWPTKGFQYLLPAAPVIAVLAGRTFVWWFLSTGRELVNNSGKSSGITASLAAIVVAFSLLVPTFLTVSGEASATGLAGSGGIPGGREAGEWIRENLPEGANVMTIGPSMANILQFYGYQRAYGLSVSANPLYRNPSYTPISNPDLQIRKGEIQYLVWDAYSARRSEFFSEKLMGYVRKYNGRVMHIESIPLASNNGVIVDEPVIIIYRVYP